MLIVGWRPKVLCPRWRLPEDLATPFLCSLWELAPWGELPLARAAEEESSADPRALITSCKTQREGEPVPFQGWRCRGATSRPG